MATKDPSPFFAEYDLNTRRKQPSVKQLHSHQKSAFDKMEKWFTNRPQPHAGGVLVLPTGGGKTLTATRFLCSTVFSAGYKVIWLAHTHHLLEQAFHSFKDSLHTILEPREKLNARVVSGTIGHFPLHQIKPTDDLLVITLQTMSNAYEQQHPDLLRFLQSTEGRLFIVFDEAHHAPAPSYRKLIVSLREKYADMYLLGLTATPTYGDESKEGWFNKLFPQKILYQISLDNLIAQKFLAKPEYISIPTDIEPDFDDRKYQAWIESQNEIPEEIINQLAKNQERNALIANAYANEKDVFGKTIIFADRWYQCEQLKEFLQQRNINAEAIYSYKGGDLDSAEERNLQDKHSNAQILDDFKNNKFDVLINVKMLTEGTDVPDVQTVFLTRRTTSETLTIQMVGRALRGKKAGGTDNAYIVAFDDRWRRYMRFAEFDISKFGDGGTDESTAKHGRYSTQYISISLVQQLIRQMESGINTNPTSYTSLLPAGFYEVRITVVRDNESTEIVRQLLMILDDEIVGYKNYIDFLLSKNLESYSSETLQRNSIELEIEDWIFRNFPNRETLNIENLRQNCFMILRHIAQNGVAPLFHTFDARNNHDLDVIAKQNVDADYGAKKIDLILRDEYGDKGKFWSVFYPNYQLFKSHYDGCVNRVLSANDTNPPIIKKPDTEHTEIIADHEPSEEIKLQVKQRDHFLCLSCGETTKRRLQIDHIRPWYLGGGNTIDNLQTLCKICNGDKDIQEINFTVSTNRTGQKPLDFLPSVQPPSGEQMRDTTEWEKYIRRNINFFYRCAAVNTVTIGQKGDKLRNWEIELFIGNDPTSITPYLEELTERINELRAAYELSQIVNISVWGDSGTGKVVQRPEKQSTPKVRLQDVPNGTIATFNYNGKDYTGTINDGQIAVKRKGIHNTLSAASNAITGTNRNGWQDWWLILPNRKTAILADTWRQKQLEKQQK